MTANLVRAIESTREAEVGLLHELRRIGERHTADHDVESMCATLAERTERRLAVLEERLGRHGDDPGASTWEGWDHLVVETGHETSTATARDPRDEALLVGDLRRLYLASQEVFLDWSLLKQGAMATRDAALLEETKEQIPEVERVAMWAKTRVKLAAPQVLAG